LSGPIQTVTPISVAKLMSIAPRSKAPDLVRHFRRKKVRPARKATSGEVTTVQDASLSDGVIPDCAGWFVVSAVEYAANLDVTRIHVTH
jgi:hypothetical protein